MGVWQGQFTKLRSPSLYNLRADPFEKGTESLNYAKWIDSFKEFPPRAKAASFSVSDVMERITAANASKKLTAAVCPASSPKFPFRCASDSCLVRASPRAF